MITAISGSRYATDKHADLVRAQIKSGITYHIGDARGVDAIARRFALSHVEFKAEWKGKWSGPARNKKMLANATALIAFPMKGKSNRGTNNAINQAKKKGIEVLIIELEE